MWKICANTILGGAASGRQCRIVARMHSMMKGVYIGGFFGIIPQRICTATAIIKFSSCLLMFYDSVSMNYCRDFISPHVSVNL